jgi:hypothetical protein
MAGDFKTGKGFDPSGSTGYSPSFGGLTFKPFELPPSKIPTESSGNAAPDGNLCLVMQDFGDFKPCPSVSSTTMPEGSPRPAGAPAPTGK